MGIWALWRVLGGSIGRLQSVRVKVPQQWGCGGVIQGGGKGPSTQLLGSSVPNTIIVMVLGTGRYDL